MNQCAATCNTDAVTWLWSGGAADCIIVAAYANHRAYITHVDRLTDEGDWLPALGRAMGGERARVYLASTAVNNNPGGLLANVREALNRTADRWEAITEVNSTSFAISAVGGATLSNLVTGHLNGPPPRGMGFGEVYWSLPRPAARVQKKFAVSKGGAKESPF